ncbi:MAG: hypothetical protein ACMG5Z_05270, partial [Luteimonas sp.]
MRAGLGNRGEDVAMGMRNDHAGMRCGVTVMIRNGITPRESVDQGKLKGHHPDPSKFPGLEYLLHATG